MKTTAKLLTATIGLGLLMAAPLAMAGGQAKADADHRTHDGKKAHMGDHDSSQPGTDTWITTKVKGDLLVSEATPGREISVETVNGIVTLSGTVATQQEHDQAISKAKAIKGVKSVNASSLKVSKR